MLSFIPPILPTANITLNKGSNPDQCLARTHTHAVKDTRSNSTSVLALSYLDAVITLSACFCLLFLEKSFRVKNKWKHYINNRLVVLSLQACNRV